MKIKAEYHGTVTKPVRAQKTVNVPCANDKRIVHTYEKDEIIGAAPINHHYTFGKPGDAICGGFYIRVGEEIPDFIELHSSDVLVKLKDLGLVLEIAKDKQC